MAQPRVILFVFFLSIFWLIASCSGKRTITFASLEPGSQISVVPLDSPDSEGRKVRNPAQLDAGLLTKEAVRISATGKASQFWFMPDNKGQRLQIKVKSLPSCDNAEGGRNRSTRLLLKAYQALYAKDYRMARELAGNASVIDATLAAPHIIAGLAYLREGDKENARTSFNKAKALDPEDAEIDVLLRTLL